MSVHPSAPDKVVAVQSVTEASELAQWVKVLEVTQPEGLRRIPGSHGRRKEQVSSSHPLISTTQQF